MKHNLILQSLPDKDQQFFNSQGATVRFPKGTTLFRDGDACNNFVLVTDGSISVQKTGENGRQITLYHVGNNNVCILTTACLVGDSHYNAEGVAESDVEAVVLSKDKFKSLMDQSPNFRQTVFSSLASRITTLIEKIDEISFTKISLRLANLLWSQKDASNRIEMSHQDLADELGTAREVVSRQIKTFEKLGWLRSERRQIQVLVPDFIEKVQNLVDRD